MSRLGWKVIVLNVRCWKLIVASVSLLFCAALVVVAACVCFTAASFHRHMYSWKDALAFAEKNASVDNTPVLICSDIPSGKDRVMQRSSVWRGLPHAQSISGSAS
jgi:hypothetical protein